MDAKAYAARNRQGSDWFTHSAEAEPIPRNTRGPVTNAPPADKVQIIKPVCNSNQWFKHGEEEEPAKPSVDVGDSKPVKMENSTSSACATWCIGGGEAKGQDFESKSRVVTKEGEANCIRDKSSSNWFSHAPNDKVPNTPSHRMGSAEGSQNASRMRGESENWFSHDPNAPSEPLHSSKGRPTSKAHGSDMYNVFHHDQ